MTFLIILYVLLLFTGMPIGIWLGIGGLFFMYLGGIPPLMVVQKYIEGIDSFVLLAVPLFTLAGGLMNECGLTGDLIEFSMKLFGRLRGALAYASVLANIVLAGVSGSASADAAAIGTLLIPAMEKQGYKRDYAGAVIAAGSIIGPIIPPSIAMIILGVVCNLSIGGLWAAGIIPGIIFGVGLMALCFYYAVKEKHPKVEEAIGLKEVWRAFVQALPALIMPVIVLGGIRLGVVTPTEGAAVAVLYALLYGIIGRRLSLEGLRKSLEATVLVTAAILLIVGLANTVGYMLAIRGVPDAVYRFVLSLKPGFVAYMLVSVLFFTIVGCLMETAAAIYIFAPIMLKGAMAVGIDPLFYGFIMVLTLIVGMVTPPVGVSLFVISAVGKIPMTDLVKRAFPFILVLTSILVVFALSPTFVMWFPKLLGFVE
ncbi:TRAP transporter large permease [Neomoorella humiferrea]|uniref:TRAP transporter large permease n=1 Tax=Neomoorella humiferrea TaxID=676965 RepID=UPI003D8CA4A0